MSPCLHFPSNSHAIYIYIRICTSYVDPNALLPFICCCLIALDKCSGVRPIGIGEVVWRIIGRAIISIMKDDIQAAAGTVQTYAGQEAGCEATVHAMKQVFESPDADAVILVDTTHAFNTLNHENALRNIQHLCPPIDKFLINIGRVLRGNHPRRSPSHGDVWYCSHPTYPQVANEQVQQVWFADNATEGTQLTPL